jgi:16S rRNA (uracil1498-N3)-methyltransferase
MRRGDGLVLFTGEGGEFASTIDHVERQGVVVHVDAFAAIERESPLQVTLVQAVIAADMMDVVVRRTVELGVAAIVPVQAARSQGLAQDRALRRERHWRRIAIAACEQCGRNRVPSIAPIVALAEGLAGLGPAAAPRVILDPAATRTLASVAAQAVPRALIVGPEGGFTPDEQRSAGAIGAVQASLGTRVLRAETAALAALAIVGAMGEKTG